MRNDQIRLRGARQNNLHDLDLDIDKHSLIAVVGVSGSGKSSLVFDTLAAEAPRQVNSTFSAFAQNYLPSYGRPDADLIENLSASVVIDQRRLIGGPRSTVATITDTGDWMRMLYSRASTPHVGYSYAFSANDPAGMHVPDLPWPRRREAAGHRRVHRREPVSARGPIPTPRLQTRLLGMATLCRQRLLQHRHLP